MTGTESVRRRDTSALALASLGSGVLAYIVFAVATRALGPEGAAPVSVLWTCWSLAAAAVTFPIQHWLTRTVAAYGGFLAARPVLPAAAGLVMILALVVGLGGWLVRGQLFSDDGVGFPVLVAALVVGSAFTGLVRGALTSSRRFNALAMSLLAENGARCIAVLTLAALGNEQPLAYGTAIVAAQVTAFLWPRALTSLPDGSQLKGGRRAALALLSGASGGQLLAQVVLTGGPVLLAVVGGAPAEVTALFVGLAVYRAPHIVAMGVVPQLTGRLTVLVTERRVAELARVRLLLGATAIGTAAGAVAIGLWVGPPLIRVVFGSDIDLEPRVSAMIAVGSVFAVANLVISVLVIAYDRARFSTLAWLAGLACAAGVALTGLSAADRIAAGFLIAEAVAFAVFYAVTLSAPRREAGPSSP